jgi:hypothetical protein
MHAHTHTHARTHMHTRTCMHTRTHNSHVHLHTRTLTPCDTFLTSCISRCRRSRSPGTRSTKDAATADSDDPSELEGGSTANNAVCRLGKIDHLRAFEAEPNLSAAAKLALLLAQQQQQVVVEQRVACDLCEQMGVHSEASIACDECDGVAMCSACNTATHTRPEAPHKSHRTRPVLHITAPEPAAHDQEETARDDIKAAPDDGDGALPAEATSPTTTRSEAVSPNVDYQSEGRSCTVSPTSPRRMRGTLDATVVPAIVELDRLPFKSEMRPIRSK